MFNLISLFFPLAHRVVTKTKQIVSSKIINDDKNSVGWEKPDARLIPTLQERPFTAANETEHIAKITPLLKLLEYHDGNDLDQDYTLNIWGKFTGDKGKPAHNLFSNRFHS